MHFRIDSLVQPVDRSIFLSKPNNNEMLKTVFFVLLFSPALLLFLIIWLVCNFLMSQGAITMTALAFESIHSNVTFCVTVANLNVPCLVSVSNSHYRRHWYSETLLLSYCSSQVMRVKYVFPLVFQV